MPSYFIFHPKNNKAVTKCMLIKEFRIEGKQLSVSANVCENLCCGENPEDPGIRNQRPAAKNRFVLPAFTHGSEWITGYMKVI
jgi:hypothetical protein